VFVVFLIWKIVSNVFGSSFDGFTVIFKE
jgi:hypothetical protein